MLTLERFLCFGLFSGALKPAGMEISEGAPEDHRWALVVRHLQRLLTDAVTRWKGWLCLRWVG